MTQQIYCRRCGLDLRTHCSADSRPAACPGCGTPVHASKPPSGYLSQFARNPIGTYFFGPRLPQYQSDRDAASVRQRKRYFHRWVGLLVAMTLSAILLPLLAGLSRGDIELATGGVLLGLVAFFWPTVIFLMGMLMYAAASFEWNWFFRSRTLRHARGMFGDSGARTFYLVFGRVLMVGGAVVAIGSSLVIATGLRVGPLRPAGKVLSGRQRVQVAEQNVEQTRQLFEKSADALLEQIGRREEVWSRIANSPSDLGLRQEELVIQERLAKDYADYRLFRHQWQESVSRLREVVEAEDRTSRVLQTNRIVPPSLDISESKVQSEASRFPLEEVRRAVGRIAAIKRTWESRQGAVGQLPPSSLARLLENLDESRAFLLEVEREFGYRCLELVDLPSREELSNWPGGNDTGVESDSLRTPTDQLDGRWEIPLSPESDGRQVPPRNTDSESTLLEIALLPGFAPDRNTLRGRVSVVAGDKGPVLITESLGEHVLVYWDGPALPRRYEVAASVTRLEGEGAVFLVLDVLGRPAALVMDGGDALGPRTGVVAVDRHVLSSPGYPDPLLKGTLFPQGQRKHVVCTVDYDRITLRVEDAVVYEWNGQIGRLTLPPFYRSQHRHKLHAGSFRSRFQIEGLKVRILQE